jgi:hypothetical protein
MCFCSRNALTGLHGGAAGHSVQGACKPLACYSRLWLGIGWAGLVDAVFKAMWGVLAAFIGNQRPGRDPCPVLAGWTALLVCTDV